MFIRKRVAELCGFTDIKVAKKKYQSTDVSIVVKPTEIWRIPSHGFAKIIPHYELSLDAITQAFDDHNLTYTLKKQNYKETGGSGYIAVNGVGGTHYSDTAAKAMCYLFIHCMEGK